jgi:glycosyltransferase involved in cell wall biosynthesis
MFMFLSVIVPVYKVEKYLSQCVESVLSQTFSDFEVILVDDGSPDRSGEICDAFASKDPRVSALHKPNGGQADARNFGLKKAIGDYVFFLDSDDYLSSSEFFSDAYHALSCGADAVLFKYRKYFENTGRMGEVLFSFSSAMDAADEDEKLFRIVSSDALYSAGWMKILRRTILTGNGIEFDRTLSCEDMDWYFYVLEHLRSTVLLDVPYIIYRQRSDSVSHSAGLKNLRDYLLTLEKWSDRIRDTEMNELRRKALNGALAKLYSNLLVFYCRVPDDAKKAEKMRVKKLSFLLNYALSRRPLLMKKVYRVGGFGAVCAAIRILDKGH